MNKLDEEILLLIREWDLTSAITTEQLVSQIKQTILKAIMDAKPEREPTMNPEEWAMGYEYGIEQFESVIKDLLSPKQSKTK